MQTNVETLNVQSHRWAQSLLNLTIHQAMDQTSLDMPLV